MIDVRYTITLTNETCACETPYPCHVGTHPTTCHSCKGMIE